MYPVSPELVTRWIQDRQDEAREQRLAKLARHGRPARLLAIPARFGDAIFSRRTAPAVAPQTCSCQA